MRMAVVGVGGSPSRSVRLSLALYGLVTRVLRCGSCPHCSHRLCPAEIFHWLDTASARDAQLLVEPGPTSCKDQEAS